MVSLWNDTAVAPLLRTDYGWSPENPHDPYAPRRRRVVRHSAGLDPARLARCVASGATAADVRADAERARRSGATSTPTFYIEGALLEGAAPVTVFRTVLDSIYRTKTAAGAR